MDYGATHHITPDLSALSIVKEYKGHDQLSVASGQGLPISQYGISTIPNSFKPFKLTEVLRFPNASKSLLFVQKLTVDNHYFAEFSPKFFCVKDQETLEALFTGSSDHGLYPFRPSHFKSANSQWRRSLPLSKNETRFNLCNVSLLPNALYIHIW